MLNRPLSLFLAPAYHKVGLIDSPFLFDVESPCNMFLDAIFNERSYRYWLGLQPVNQVLRQAQRDPDAFKFRGDVCGSLRPAGAFPSSASPGFGILGGR